MRLGILRLGVGRLGGDLATLPEEPGVPAHGAGYVFDIPLQRRNLSPVHLRATIILDLELDGALEVTGDSEDVLLLLVGAA